MKITASIQIDLGQHSGSYTSNVLITSEELFHEILALGYRDFWYRPDEREQGSYGFIQVRDELPSPRFETVLKLLQDHAGLTPLPTGYVKQVVSEKHFPIDKKRTYSKRDLDAAPFLCIAPKNVIIATWHHQKADETIVVTADHNQKNARVFGTLWPVWVYCFADPLRAKLVEQKFAGLRFDPIELVPAKKAIKPLWTLSSEIILPRCLLPYVRGDGMPFEGDFSLQSFLDDEGYDPVELRYKQSDLAACGPFDVAVTTERIAGGSDAFVRYAVVSQRFRKAIMAMKVPGIDFVPVRVVD